MTNAVVVLVALLLLSTRAASNSMRGSTVIAPQRTARSLSGTTALIGTTAAALAEAEIKKLKTNFIRSFRGRDSQPMDSESNPGRRLKSNPVGLAIMEALGIDTLWKAAQRFEDTTHIPFSRLDDVSW